MKLFWRLYCMDMQMKIDALLRKHFTPSHLKIINESYLHEGHQSFENPSETHFKVIISSLKFKGKNKVSRHRDIYAVLDGCFKEGLHSLVIEDLES